MATDVLRGGIDTPAYSSMMRAFGQDPAVQHGILARINFFAVLNYRCFLKHWFEPEKEHMADERNLSDLRNRRPDR